MNSVGERSFRDGFDGEPLTETHDPLLFEMGREAALRLDLRKADTLLEYCENDEQSPSTQNTLLEQNKEPEIVAFETLNAKDPMPVASRTRMAFALAASVIAVGMLAVFFGGDLLTRDETFRGLNETASYNWKHSEMRSGQEFLLEADPDIDFSEIVERLRNHTVSFFLGEQDTTEKLYVRLTSRQDFVAFQQTILESASDGKRYSSWFEENSPKFVNQLRALHPITIEIIRPVEAPAR